MAKNQLENENINLNEDGVKEAKLLSQSRKIQDIDLIYSSKYKRAISTAEYIAKQNNILINIDSSFNERKLGDIDSLKILGKTLKNTFTQEQLKDKKLKNKDGESREEVTKRFSLSLDKIVEENKGKKVVILSHGAAIRFELLKWCTLNDKYEIVYNGNVILKDKLELPSVIKLSFIDSKIANIERVNCYEK